MSTTKHPLVKAEKPQDQTSASKVQALIDHSLEDQTTGLSDAMQEAMTNSLFYGNSMIKVGPAINGTNTIHTTATTASISNNLRRTILSTGQEVQTNMIEIKEHEAFNAPVATLLNLWLTRFGNEWIDLEDIESDEFFAIAYKRLKQMGELEQHYLTDRARYVCRKPE